MRNHNLIIALVVGVAVILGITFVLTKDEKNEMPVSPNGDSVNAERKLDADSDGDSVGAEARMPGDPIPGIDITEDQSGSGYEANDQGNTNPMYEAETSSGQNPVYER